MHTYILYTISMYCTMIKRLAIRTMHWLKFTVYIRTCSLAAHLCSTCSSCTALSLMWWSGSPVLNKTT